MLLYNSSPKSSRPLFESFLIFVQRIILAFINDHIKIADLLLPAHVRPMFRVFVHPIWRHHNIEHIIKQVHLDDPIDFSRRCQRRGRVHFQQPRFQGPVDKHIIAVALKAVFVVDYYTLHALQGDVDDVVDFFETLVCQGLASHLLQVETEVLNAPLRTMLLVVVFRVLVDSYVC